MNLDSKINYQNPIEIPTPSTCLNCTLGTFLTTVPTFILFIKCYIVVINQRTAESGGKKFVGFQRQHKVPKYHNVFWGLFQVI